MIRRLAILFVVAAAAAIGFLPTGGVEVAAGQEPEDAADDVTAGERIFQADCAMCHGVDASGMMGMHPSLRGAIDRLSREGVEVAIRNGRRTQPPMPAFDDRLTVEEIDDVVAYIASLPDGPRNFGPGDDGGMMGDGMMMDGRMDAGDVALVALGVLAVAGLVGAAVILARGRGSPRRQLDRRYAAGDLSRDEYLRARRDLRQG